MHTLIIQSLLSLLLCVFTITTLQAEESCIPTSVTSVEAYQRVAPRLISEMVKKDLNFGAPVFIRIFKLEKELEIWIRKGLTYTLFKTYGICDLSGTLGPKIKEGDKQSPEGFYTVGVSQLNPHSSYHLSFNLGFPNEYDRSRKRTGSVLMVHGRCSSAGCYAMTDYRMEEIYAIAESAITLGQQQIPVHIFPFHMTSENMETFKDSQWVDFWKNLRKGYDHFEGNKFPPIVTVNDQEYQFITFRPLLFGGKFLERIGYSDYSEYRKNGITVKPPVKISLLSKTVQDNEEKQTKSDSTSYFRDEENSSYL